MPPEDPPLTPPPVPPVPRLAAARPPVPLWMWLLFGLGMIPVGILVSLAGFGGNSGDVPGLVMAGGTCGFVCSLPMLGGLALSGRFYRGIGARIGGALLFAALLTVGLGAVCFAGCMCILATNSGSFR